MPKFYYKGIECVSAGIIFYRYNNGRYQFMLQKKVNSKGREIYEDLGGRSLYNDKSIFHVAAREAAEETNGKIIDYSDSSISPKETVCHLELSKRNIVEKESCIVKSKYFERPSSREALKQISGVHDNTSSSAEINNTQNIRNKDSCKYILSLINQQNGIPQVKSKYVVFFVYYPLSYEIDFDDREYHPKKDIMRSIEWVDINNIKKNMLNHRIKHIIKYF